MHFMYRIMVFMIIHLLLIAATISAQTEDVELDKETTDSLYILEVETPGEPAKVLHAEPLFIDLIRDLGARKGEKEWNVGFGLTDNNNFDEYTALVEYEWAPVNRLGLEIELPFSLYYPTGHSTSHPESKLDGIKLAAQYSFFVSEKYSTSMAIGYIHEFELPAFSGYGNGKLHTGNVYNPFFVAAKRWGNNFHTLLYSGPVFNQHFHDKNITTTWQFNSNFHYMIPGTRNFIGIEFNKEVLQSDLDIVIRPQMRVSIADNLLIGIVTGIPVKRENQRFSSFMRLIYEPDHRTNQLH